MDTLGTREHRAQFTAIARVAPNSVSTLKRRVARYRSGSGIREPGACIANGHRRKAPEYLTYFYCLV